MQDMEKNWIGDEYRFTGLIDDLSTVFGDVVFPLNKFTRRRAALRGSSLVSARPDQSDDNRVELQEDLQRQTGWRQTRTRRVSRSRHCPRRCLAH